MIGLAIIGIVWIIYDLIKEVCEPTIPAGYRNNRELYQHDLYTLDAKTLEKNLKNGKYR